MKKTRQRSELVRLVIRIYDELLVKKFKHQTFWILSAFIPTFLIARLTVNFAPGVFLQVKGNHVHHFAYGFILLAISGYIAIVRPLKSIWIAILFGIGLALSVDEAGMWLHLTNYYYNDTSEDAIILVSAILINIVYLRAFWIGLTREIFKLLKLKKQK